MVVAIGVVAGPGVIGVLATEAAALTTGLSTTTTLTASSVGGAAAAGAAVAGAVGETAVVGAATGAASTVISAVAGGAIEGAITAATLAGPVGWAIVGANGYTWDCWKPVVMDDTVNPSSGIALRDLYNHPNLQWMTVDGDGFVAENIRGEQFRITQVEVDGSLAFHATPISFPPL